jgi:putative endonuclease
MSDWWVYILKCSDGTYYCGITKDVDNRVRVHNSGKGSRYTRGRLPVTLLEKRGGLTESEARKYEFALKRLPKDRKVKKLVKGIKFQGPRDPSLSVEERAWSYVDKSGGPNACWPWTGHVSKRHYNKPSFNHHHELRKGKIFVVKVWAQRYIYGLHLGRKVPKHLMVFIVCGNHLCCNPAHMEMHKHGWHGNRKYDYPMTASQVELASQLWCSGSMNQQELGKQFEVSPKVVGYALSGKSHQKAVRCRKKRKHNFYKLSTEAVKAIRSLRADKVSLRTVAEMFGISVTYACKVARKKLLADV